MSRRMAVLLAAVLTAAASGQDRRRPARLIPPPAARPAVPAPPAFFPPAGRPVRGDAVIRGRAGPSDVVITTTSRTAGAVHSLTWLGREFIDSTDHGRQLQSAAAFGDDGPGFWAECYNPTEAGSRRDGVGPRSTSLLAGLQAAGSRLNTVTRMAFWLAPGEQSEGRPARNPVALSNHLLMKEVAIGYRSLAHAVSYRATFAVPPFEPRHTLAQFEAVTGYMPAVFEKFWTFDPASGRLAPLTDGPGEQPLPVVFGTADGAHAMGVWSPDAGASYGRFRFPLHGVVKWNCVFRARHPHGVPAGNYTFQTFVAVGTLQNVRDTLAALPAEVRR